MAASSHLTGNWSGVRKTLQNASKTCKDHLRRAVLREAIRLAGNIQVNITERGHWANKPFAPNAESTIKRKKRSSPLIHNADLRNAVAAHRLDADKVLVGIAGDASRKHKPIGDYIAEYARIHEFGAAWTTSKGKQRWIPARPFIGPVVDCTRKARQKAWKGELAELLQTEKSTPHSKDK